MGWTTCSAWGSKAAVVAAVLSECYGPGTVIESASTRSGLWVVSERDGKRYIDLHLISKEGGDYGYKSMSESSHPYYYDCPVKFLGMVPVASPEWRAKVLAAVASKAVTYSPGDKVTVYGKSYTVVGSRTTSSGRAGGYLIKDETGKVYRTTAAKMTADVEAEWKARYGDWVPSSCDY